MPEQEAAQFVAFPQTDEDERSIGTVGLYIEHGSIGWPYAVKAGRRYTRYVTRSTPVAAGLTEQQLYDRTRSFLLTQVPSAEASLAAYLQQPVTLEMINISGGRVRNAAAVAWIVVGSVGGIWFVVSCGREILRIRAAAQMRARARAIERAFLCPKCRYDLRGLTELICPECGYDARRT